MIFFNKFINNDWKLGESFNKKYNFVFDTYKKNN